MEYCVKLDICVDRLADAALDIVAVLDDRDPSGNWWRVNGNIGNSRAT
jgi:hypothetical protein